MVEGILSLQDHGNDGYYRMVKREIPAKSSIHRKDITNRLNNDGLITVARQEAVKARSYRDSIVSRYTVVPWLHQKKSNYAGLFNDEFWDKMWYLQDLRTNSTQPVVDMNVVPVLLKLKIIGEGVNITIPDNGFETSHPDMEDKFQRELSWNFISNNNNISPDIDAQGNYMAHGTKCAGELVMQPNNKLCGVGVAHGANIGGIKFLDSTSTDAREAKVLVYALQYVSIYSNSWGPTDTGAYMEHLSEVVKKSLGKGISRGRDGKGTIYVFAAGNGKSEGDNCACDGYVTSMYTVVVASCDDSGHVIYYSERCAAILTTAYGGAPFQKGIVTTDVKGTCTEKHSGTSAAAPLVSGIIALGLSANPNLSWRDVQHLIARTSQVAPLSDNYGWNLNAAGFYYSVDFGFGLMDAFKFVQEAQKWKNVPDMSSCGMRLPKVNGYPVSRKSAARIIVKSDGCKGSAGEINFLEYVQLVVTMSYPKRGDIQIAMRSPSGTECRVLESRPKDSNHQGLKRWTFTILGFWGESPNGHFVIDIFDKTGPMSNNGVISELTVALHGTKDQPDAYKHGSRPYNTFTLAKQGDEPRFAQLAYENEVHVAETQDAEPIVDDHPDSHGRIDDKKKRVKYGQVAGYMHKNFFGAIRLKKSDKRRTENV